MSGGTLALYGAADAGTPAVGTWLRTLAALVACGDAPRLAALPGAALDPAALDDEALRTYETLRSFDIEIESLPSGDLVDACANAARILRVVDAQTESLFIVDDAALAEARSDPGPFLHHLATAGQVIRA